MSKVVITGLGAISALGVGADALWSNIVAGKSGITQITLLDAKYGACERPGARVPHYDPAHCFTAAKIKQMDRFSQFGVLAAREAVADACLEEEELEGAILVTGTGCGAHETYESTCVQLYHQGRVRVHPFTIPRGMASAATSQISMDLGLRGPAFSVTSACASATHAIAQAVVLIRGGLAKVAVAGGAEAPLVPGLMRCWDPLRVLSPDGCRPFAANRNGLVFGEGAGVVVLEDEQNARRRGATILAELAGVGMSSDAVHITDPSPEGAAAAMRAALADASMSTDEVDYINAHGTGTLANDKSETRAIRQVFKDDANRLLVSSTKAAHGHALGASGALELIVTTQAIRSGTAPPTLNLDKPDDDCDLCYVPHHAQAKQIRAALSNSFAFGGLNAVLAVRAIGEDLN